MPRLFMSRLFFIESLLVAIGEGMRYQSWYVLAGVLIVLLIMFLIPYVNIILSVLFSLWWSSIAAMIIAGFQIGFYIFDNSLPWQLKFLLYYSTPASQITGGIVFLGCLILHLVIIAPKRRSANKSTDDA